MSLYSTVASNVEAVAQTQGYKLDLGAKSAARMATTPGAAGSSGGMGGYDHVSGQEREYGGSAGGWDEDRQQQAGGSAGEGGRGGGWDDGWDKGGDGTWGAAPAQVQAAADGGSRGGGGAAARGGGGEGGPGFVGFDDGADEGEDCIEYAAEYAGKFVHHATHTSLKCMEAAPFCVCCVFHRC